MKLAQEQLELIEKLIKSDSKFSNNEDLYEDFFNETYKRTQSIIETIDDISTLESYLKKIVSTSIVLVLKDLGRVRRTKSSYVSTKEILTSEQPSYENTDYSNVVVNYDFIDIDSNPEEIVLKKDLLQKVYDSVVLAHNDNIEKQFLELYEYRYVEEKKQSEIATLMNLSQSEVSKRLLDLTEYVKSVLN